MSTHDEIMAMAVEAADIRSSDTAQFYAGNRVSERNYKEALAALSAAIAELVRDADRYRWLRGQDWYSGALCVVRNPKVALARGAALGIDCPSLARLDEAVDSARRAP